MNSRTPSYITKNRLGIYILQIRIPAHIRHNKKTLIQRSLKTRNRREALKIARKLVVQMEDNNFDIDKLDRETDRDNWLFHIGKPIFEELNRLSDEGDNVEIDNFLTSLTSEQEEGLRYIADLNNSNIDHFQQLLSEGDRDKTAEFLEQLPRIFKKPIKDVLNQHVADNRPNPPSAPQQPVYPDKKNPTLDVVYDKWVEKAVSRMARSSQEEYKRMVSLFLRIIKEQNNNIMPRVSELTTDMINEYRDTFEDIPAYVNTEGKSLAELTSMEGKKNKSETTIKNTYSNIGTFIQWVASKGHPIEHNIHAVLTHYHRIKKSDKKHRVPLDDNDLQSIFQSENYRQGKWTRASEFFVPLIALYTGMTMSEIVQLETGDVYYGDDYHVIDINDSGSKRIKVEGDDENSTGRPRHIPVHKQLVELGFIDFVDYQKSKDETRLFPCEKRNKDDKFDAYQKRFANFRKKIGVVPRDNKEMRDFHSFRHLMKTKLREVEKGDGIIDDILGHSSKSRSATGNTYDHSQQLKFKYDALKKIKYDCIDFRLIKGWKHHRFM